MTMETTVTNHKDPSNQFFVFFRDPHQAVDQNNVVANSTQDWSLCNEAALTILDVKAIGPHKGVILEWT